MPRSRPPEAGPVDPKDWVCLAVVGAPKGVRGAVRLTCYNENPAEIGSFGPLHAGPGGKAFAVRVIETPKPQQVVVKITGIEDRDAAAALNGTRLFVPREAMPAPEEDEFYHHDLIGLAVEHVDGRLLGRVRAVIDNGAGHVLEVLDPDGPDSVMIPFTLEAVPSVDLSAGKVLVDPPLGLIDAP
jgi:16S rRNA processing protein RimM